MQERQYKPGDVIWTTDGKIDICALISHVEYHDNGIWKKINWINTIDITNHNLVSGNTNTLVNKVNRLATVQEKEQYWNDINFLFVKGIACLSCSNNNFITQI